MAEEPVYEVHTSGGNLSSATMSVEYHYEWLTLPEVEAIFANILVDAGTVRRALHQLRDMLRAEAECQQVAVQPVESPVNEKDLRRRIMAAIRSYGYSRQDKADLESRADGVMIVLGEYVLPFVRRQPERESSEEVHLLRHRGFIVHLDEPLTPEEETELRNYLDFVRDKQEAERKPPAIPSLHQFVADHCHAHYPGFHSACQKCLETNGGPQDLDKQSSALADKISQKMRNDVEGQQP